MRTLFRARIEAQLLTKAESICDRMGTKPQDAVRMFLTALVAQERFPWTPAAPPAKPVPGARKGSEGLEASPQPGQVYEVEIGNGVGLRPFLVLSLPHDGLVIVVPLKDAAGGSTFQALVPKVPWLPDKTRAFVHGVRALEARDLGRLLGTFKKEELNLVRSALRELLGI